MIEIRPFRNADPPQLLKLWHAARLGRGAVEGVTVDAFETLVYSQPYFDRRGLLVACDDGRVVGFAHAGFGSAADGSKLDVQTGVICAVVVHPERRRQGIGRQLVAGVEAYLAERGATTILAGAAPDRDPFYFGLYGGSAPAGFLESDANAAPFMTALGYEPIERHGVFDRDIASAADPIDFRLTSLRRQSELSGANQPCDASWWWTTRYGRMDSLQFFLVPKGVHLSAKPFAPKAVVTVLDLELFSRKWHERTIGLCEIVAPVTEDEVQLGRVLMLEVCRRLREELYSRVEAHAPESRPLQVRLLESSGFTRIDVGVVYRRASH